MKIIYQISIPALFTGILTIIALSGSVGKSVYKPDWPSNKNTVNYEFLPYLDTVYLLSDEYIEISLKQQLARLYFRNGDTLEFKISSGNPFIKKGISTPEGIFTVQSKYREAVSKQFNNAKLFNWIGFNGNIGFHGLEGRGYYNHLGQRPSSHGCVRISTEDGEQIFKSVKVGTPVIVHNGSPARVFRFAYLKEMKANYDMILMNDRNLLRLMKKRLKNLYSGEAYRLNRGKIFMDGRSVLRFGGIDVGLFELIPSRQKNHVDNPELLAFRKDNANLTFNYYDISVKDSSSN